MKMRGNLAQWRKYFFIYLFLVAICKLQSTLTWRLTKQETQDFFGIRDTHPEYSIFTPQIYDQPENGRSKRHAFPHGSKVFQFAALGNNYKFNLEPVTNLLSEQFVIINRRETHSFLLDWPYNNCSFQGKEQAGGRQVIALVMCGKLRGVVKGPNEELVIEPLPERLSMKRRRRRSFPDSRVEDYIVYRRSSQVGCPLQEEIGSPKSLFEERSFLYSRTSESAYNFYPISEKPKEAFYHHYATRNNRFSGRKSELLHIETAVYVDRDLLDHMKTNFPSDTEAEVVKVVLAMINAVQLLYNDPSLGHKVKYVLKRLELLYHDPPGLVRDHNIDKFLTQFCTWQDRENPKLDSDPLHWDHALILTGLDLFTVGIKQKINSQVVGLAPVSGMCTRTSSCTVNEGRHFESVYVVAHEIGHNLGMRHDGLQSGNSCDPSGYLMSPTLGSGKVTWSHCSKRYLDEFLSSPSDSKCLRDTPRQPPVEFNHEGGGKLPGQRFTADQQCFLKYGEGSRASAHQPLEEICRDLHCTKGHFSWTSHPALEGTYCGQRKWCQRGYCTEGGGGGGGGANLPYSQGPLGFSTSHSKEEEGGPWGSWSECHSSCLYGMKGFLSGGSTGLSLSESQCRSCLKRQRYRACSAVRTCSRRNKMTLQDYADDICRGLSRSDGSLTGYSVRIPPQGIQLCEIKCTTRKRDIIQSRKFFPDGTVCWSPTDYPTYCMNGFCTEFRCEEGAYYDAGSLFCHSDERPPPGPFPPPLLPPERLPTVGAPDSSLSDAYPDLLHSTSISESSWGPWIPSSDCRASCITPGKGIQLVSRLCESSQTCDGISRNIKLCDSNRSQCSKVDSPFEYATAVCQRYSKDVQQLSGYGMQLSSTSDDPNRGCIVACQDAELNYRFYRVNGREGWFPFGVECSPHLNGYRSYCLNGKCLEFSTDGTPVREKSSKRQNRSLHQMFETTSGVDIARLTLEEPVRSSSSHVLSGLDYREVIDLRKQTALLQSPRKRDLRRKSFTANPNSSPHFHWRRRRRNVNPSFRRIAGSFGDDFLLSLIEEVNATISKPVESYEGRKDNLDFKNPIFYGEFSDQNPATATAEEYAYRHKERDLQAREALYYWTLEFIECSVTCGTGIKRRVMECRDTQGQIVSKSLCPSGVGVKESSQLCFSGIACEEALQKLSISSPNNSKTSAVHSQFGQWLVDSINEIRNKIQ